MKIMSKTIGIIGCRIRNGQSDFQQCKTKFLEIYEKGDKIVSGGCPKGGDKFAEIIAKELGLTEENGMLVLHRTEWDKHGKSAGFVRNKYIARDADVLIAVVSPERKGGTEHTIDIAKSLNKKIILCEATSYEEVEPVEEFFDIFAIT